LKIVKIRQEIRYIRHGQSEQKDLLPERITLLCGKKFVCGYSKPRKNVGNVRLSPDYYISLLAAAYAELKQFDQAKEFNQNAIKDEKNYRLKRYYQQRQEL